MRSSHAPGILAGLALWAVVPCASVAEESVIPGKDENKTEPTEREKKILDLFTASSKHFKDGRITLVYDFEGQQQDLVEDWMPTLKSSGMRIRWARGQEGTYSTIEHGIIIGDHGEWIHEAVFLPDIEVQVENLTVSQYKPGNILAPVFYCDKKKLSLAANSGFQTACLKGWRHAKPPSPKEERKVSSNDRHTIGYKLKGGVFEAQLNKRKTHDSSAIPRFTEGFDNGHVGLAWSGSVQSFIFKVTIEGRLDPAWVAKQLKEPPPPKDQGKSVGTGPSAAKDKVKPNAAVPKKKTT